ncbi:MAG: hypothetical protein GAK45_01338 [Pseudomonas citronellolis]|nr:MAG: hypothetical protein GAK45_01338 [Pseudomonas citronellolis]
MAQAHEQGVQADEAGELPLREFLDHGVEVTRVGHQDVVVAGEHHRHAMEGEGVDVVQRQRGDEDFATFIEVGAHQCLALQHVGDQVAVREHRALGDPGGATGVLQHGHVVATRGGFADALATALGQRVGQLDRLRDVVGRDHFLQVLDRGVDHEALERRQHVAHFGDDHLADAGARQYILGQMGHVGQADQGLGAGIVELVFHLPRGVQRVGVDHDEAGAHGTEYHDRILQHVGQLHGDAVAGLEVGVLLQVGSERSGERVQLAVGQRLAKVAEGRLVGKALAGLFQYRQDVRVLVSIDLGSDTRWIFVLPEIVDHGSPLLSYSSFPAYSGILLCLCNFSADRGPKAGRD